MWVKNGPCRQLVDEKNIAWQIKILEIKQWCSVAKPHVDWVGDGGARLAKLFKIPLVSDII